MFSTFYCLLFRTFLISKCRHFIMLYVYDKNEMNLELVKEIFLQHSAYVFYLDEKMLYNVIIYEIWIGTQLTSNWGKLERIKWIRFSWYKWNRRQRTLFEVKYVFGMHLFFARIQPFSRGHKKRWTAYHFSSYGISGFLFI